MRSARLKKYDTGRARKSRHREKADRLLVECGMGDYLAGGERQATGGDVAVMTLSAPETRPAGNGSKASQMLLWDQPVKVAPSAASRVSSSPDAPPKPDERPTTKANPVQNPGAFLPPHARQVVEREEVTLLGLLKGMGVGLAVAVVLLGVYLLIS